MTPEEVGRHRGKENARCPNPPAHTGLGDEVPPAATDFGDDVPPAATGFGDEVPPVATGFEDEVPPTANGPATIGWRRGGGREDEQYTKEEI